MRGRGILAALLGVALLLSACGETPTLPTESPTEAPVPSATPTQPPGTAELVLPWYSGESAHPLTGTNQANLNLAPLVYEGLFELDEHFAPHGVLCSGQSVSEDGLTWTFTLRPGAVFSDGTPLTAREVVSSLQTAMGANSPYSARLGNVRGVREGDGGVVISLLEPNGNLPALLDIPVVKEGGGDPLGTGPYTLDREGGLLRKNTDWWKGAEVNLRELTWEAYHTALTEGDFDLYLGQVRLTGDFDLSPLLRVGGKLNYGGYADPETEALLGTYLAANDTTRPAAAYDLGQKLGEMTPFSVLCFKNASLLTHWGKISGVKASQQNIFYGLEGWRLN